MLFLRDIYYLDTHNARNWLPYFQPSSCCHFIRSDIWCNSVTNFFSLDFHSLINFRHTKKKLAWHNHSTNSLRRFSARILPTLRNVFWLFSWLYPWICFRHNSVRFVFSNTPSNWIRLGRCKTHCCNRGMDWMAVCSLVYLTRISVSPHIRNIPNNKTWKAYGKRKDTLWSLSMRVKLACLVIYSFLSY